MAVPPTMPLDGLKPIKAAETCVQTMRPGLGIEIDEAEVKKHPLKQELPQRVWYDDGSVGDW